jgi:TonB family protein
VNTTFQRNFIVAVTLHVAAIAGLLAFEYWWPQSARASLTPVELVVPADILGDRPVGPGTGRGAYSPPAAPPSNPIVGEAPKQPVGPAPKLLPNEIPVPKKTATPAKKTAPTKTAGASVKVASTTPAGNFDDIRRRLMGATGGSGAPGGDGQPAGGGSGKSKTIGSPNGAVNGVAGGVGQGTPHGEYFQHVHDKLYEAWDQPGSGAERKLGVVVLLRVARDGTILGANVQRSSGNRLMDESALTAVKKVGLLDPPPAPLVAGNEAAIAVTFQMEG